MASSSSAAMEANSAVTDLTCNKLYCERYRVFAAYVIEMRGSNVKSFARREVNDLKEMC